MSCCLGDNLRLVLEPGDLVRTFPLSSKGSIRAVKWECPDTPTIRVKMLSKLSPLKGATRSRNVPADKTKRKSDCRDAGSTPRLSAAAASIKRFLPFFGPNLFDPRRGCGPEGIYRFRVGERPHAVERFSEDLAR